MSDLLVLCYHSVSTQWDHPMAVTPDQLARHVSVLRGRGYRFGTLTRSVLEPSAHRTAVLTFDDGFRAVHEVALPVLTALGVAATAFVPTSFIGTQHPLAWPEFDTHEVPPPAGALAPMSWAEVRDLRDAGWEVGSHSRTHPRLPGLDAASLLAELQGSRDDCEEHLGGACTSLAYPFGDVDARVAEQSSRVGYTVGVTLERGTSPSPLRISRTCVNRVDVPLRFSLKTVRPLRTNVAAAAIGAVHRVRALETQRGRRRLASSQP